MKEEGSLTSIFAGENVLLPLLRPTLFSLVICSSFSLSTSSLSKRRMQVELFPRPTYPSQAITAFAVGSTFAAASVVVVVVAVTPVVVVTPVFVVVAVFVHVDAVVPVIDVTLFCCCSS